MGDFTPLPRRRGRIVYLRNSDRHCWGFEDWTLTRTPDGVRTLSVHCEMRFGIDDVVRDTLLSVDRDWHPVDASVRIINQGELIGTGWFHFTDTSAECESWTREQGRISQKVAISKPMRGFGVHALMGDGWLSATFPFDQGPGHAQYWEDALLHSLHHFGATGPYIHRSTSGLCYVGEETVTVPAGRFACHRIQFVNMTNQHPPYNMWISADGDCLYVKGVVEGYMDSVFELTELSGEPLT